MVQLIEVCKYNVVFVYNDLYIETTILEKRGDAKKPSIWANKNYFGKRGFKKKGASNSLLKAVNLSYLEEHLDTFLKEKKIVEKDGAYIIDLAQLGFDKLLGKGKLTKKFHVKARSASKKAEDKIKALGGEITNPKENETKKIVSPVKKEASQK